MTCGLIDQHTGPAQTRHDYAWRWRAEDAKRLGIQTGDLVQLETRRDKMVMEARVGNVCRPGLVFVPWFDPKLLINKLTINAVDPISKQPEFKICAVKVTKAPKA